MQKPKVQIVWFKRDLRTADHAPLLLASEKGAVLPVYIFEPELWQLNDASVRQWAFIADCLAELNQDLTRLGQPLVQLFGKVIGVLQELQKSYEIEAVWSHQESGNLWTFQRDLTVKAWLKSHNIAWHEFKQNPIQRGSNNQRNAWQTQAEAFFNQACLPEPTALPFLQPAGILPPNLPLPAAIAYPEQIQPGGRSKGLIQLNRFLNQRVAQYLYDIAHPIKARQNSSRLSPHLAWGSLSMREVIQAARQRQSQAPAQHQRSLTAFISRCFWQSHFMQKLETEPQIESHCLHPATETLRFDNPKALEYLHAWLAGQTGVPMIDACMRCLAHTGWLPFRMRAMVVSFASYQLWIDWRLLAPPLAQRFTDYEPGIHYSQIQMQSGTTGINAMRVYSPVKQGQDHDKHGQFIKIWCPELQALSADWIHTPWLLPDNLQQQYGVKIGETYPAPLVDIDQSAKDAKQKLAAIRKDPSAKAQAQKVFVKHGSRLKRQPAKRKPKALKEPVETNQLSLFGDEG